MIKEVQGDILKLIKELEEQDKYVVVLHQANCFNTLGRARGIAGVLDKAYPQIATVDQATIKGDPNKLGTYTKARIHERLWIINVYGQYNYGMNKNIVYTDYNALGQGLVEAVNEVLQFIPNAAFVLPKRIGSGLSNGSYEIIRNTILEPIFSNLDSYFVYI